MNSKSQHRARRVAVVAAAIAAVPAALPGSASAHHQCAQSETYLSVEPGNGSDPIDAVHQMPVWNTCGPHTVSVSHIEADGARNEIALQQGDVAYTRTEAERPRSASSPPAAAPQQESRPARRAKRSCRKSRRARERGERRATRRCRSRNRNRRR